jgi:hypothetical protein
MMTEKMMTMKRKRKKQKLGDSSISQHSHSEFLPLYILGLLVLLMSGQLKKLREGETPK